MAGSLTLVGTPIGNLSDLSPRALEALRGCDFIAAEDTRVTLKLLNRFEIRKPLISYYEHNKYDKGDAVCRRLENGEHGVLVTDAGMPAISDPGEDLVALCHERGIPVYVVPGPTAVTTALAIAGLPTARFVFEGFLPVTKKERRLRLSALAEEPRTIVLYEAPHKLQTTLADLAEALSDRRIALVRELTKIHEEVIRTTLSAALTLFEETPPRGEFVLIIEGKPAQTDCAVPLEEAVARAAAQMQNGASASDAARTVAAETGLKKNEIYKFLTKKEG